MTRLQEVVKKGPPPGVLVAAAQQQGREVKRPGEAKWLSCADSAAEQALVTPKCPNGGGTPQLVSP
jgi:hypothetical protein